MSQLVEFTLPDGTTILIEEKDADRAVTRGGKRDSAPEKAAPPFEASLERIKKSAGTLIKTLREIQDGPDEIEVEFGLKVGAEVGMFIAGGTVKANYTVKLRWTPGAAGSGKSDG